MGGLGSGRRFDREPRRLVERAFVLDVRELTAGPLRPGRQGDLTLPAPLVVWPVHAHFLIRRLDGIVATVWFDPPVRGGSAVFAVDVPVDGTRGQPYLVCPFATHSDRAHRRAVRLYWPVTDPSGFGCRRCHNLAYRSQQVRPGMPGWLQKIRRAAGLP